MIDIRDLATQIGMLHPIESILYAPIHPAQWSQLVKLTTKPMTPRRWRWDERRCQWVKRPNLISARRGRR